ncbi:MAG TPA: M23 family metallopeptidase [Desulfobacterales bacterium]|nr:M23 family metallopeptidase [Desulfobacterales bacterium]
MEALESMSNKLHIILTGEQSDTRSFVVSKSAIKVGLLVSLAVAVVLIVSSVAGVHFVRENGRIKTSVARLSNELRASRVWNNEFKERLTEEVSLREARRQDKLSELIKQNSAKQAMLTKALADLKKKSRSIESILRVVGVKIKVKSSSRNSGGPFIPLSDNTYKDLSFKVDNYLDAIRAIPLGPPVWGTITSKYGRRIDPINNKPAFHSGLDIRQKRGTGVMCTAAGVVVAQGFSRGNGNYVFVKHAMNFETKYLHMEKTLVKKGQKVKRGQVIGLLGNTGRSTGPHLHYEIVYKGRTVNPLKFVRIARYISKRSGRS